MYRIISVIPIPVVLPMNCSLFAVVEIVTPQKFRKHLAHQICVRNFEALTDDACEKMLDTIAATCLQRFPDGSVVRKKEFVSQEEWMAYRTIAAITGRHDENWDGTIHQIYMKATKVFFDSDSTKKVASLPFCMPSAVPVSDMTDKEREALKSSVLYLCITKADNHGGSTSKVDFIGEDEYNRLRDAVLNKDTSESLKPENPQNRPNTESNSQKSGA